MSEMEFDSIDVDALDQYIQETERRKKNQKKGGFVQEFKPESGVSYNICVLPVYIKNGEVFSLFGNGIIDPKTGLPMFKYAHKFQMHTAKEKGSPKDKGFQSVPNTKTTLEAETDMVCDFLASGGTIENYKSQEKFAVWVILMEDKVVSVKYKDPKDGKEVIQKCYKPVEGAEPLLFIMNSMMHTAYMQAMLAHQKSLKEAGEEMPYTLNSVAVFDFRKSGKALQQTFSFTSKRYQGRILNHLLTLKEKPAEGESEGKVRFQNVNEIKEFLSENAAKHVFHQPEVAVQAFINGTSVFNASRAYFEEKKRQRDNKE